MGRVLIIVCGFLAALLLPLLLYRSPIPVAHHSNRRLKHPPSTSEERPRRDDEDLFNVTRRLVEVFRKMDVAPRDGSVSRHELIHYNLGRTHSGFLHLCTIEMRLHDKNHDGYVSYDEYYPPSRLQNAESYDDRGWWKGDHFNASDADGDGRLNLAEFNDFRHPADSKNPKLLQWLCKEEVRERDTDRDGKISFEEFYLGGLFDLARKYDEESTQRYEGSRDAPARALFAQLDEDGDGYLSHLELLPIIGKIHPSEYYYAKQQADDIISRDDADKDGRLTLKEIIKIRCQFYMVMVANDYEDEYEYDSHDESL